MVAKLKAAGASEVIVHGDSWQDADTFLRETLIPAAASKGEQGIYTPPFDHLAIWEGNSTMIQEISTQLPDTSIPDAIVCSVGGGGLFCGVMHGLATIPGWSSVPVLALETKGADSLSQSLRAGHQNTLAAITSVAKSLGAVRVADQAFRLASTHKNVKSVVFDDAEACMACWRFADDERFLVEPACGVSVAVCYDGRLKKLLPNLTPESKVVIVVCGGSRVTLDLLAEYKRVFGKRAEELGRGNGEEEGRDVPSAHTQ